ncbi:hypothetical protein [Terracidiphilus gabretensis]|uniref:hypothetical protein n=1 Tax=Terracidiphilus gabretensis TaxID=1577687 RepID=UPI0018D204DA|nr:hypothetical protein [Terracidiphilus gabretensis]
MLTGRTLPNLANCTKLGLSPAFVCEEAMGGKEIMSLDQYLVQRDLDRRSASLLSKADLNAALAGPRGATMMKSLMKETHAAASLIGAIDGILFQWDDGRQPGGSLSELLKLSPVGAQFKRIMSAPAGGSVRGYRIDFGWVTTASGRGAKEVPTEVWRLTLTAKDGVLGWNVNTNEIVGASSVVLAGQIVKRLIEYRDEFMKTR